MTVNHRYGPQGIERIREEGAETALRAHISRRLEKIIECVEVLRSDELRQWKERNDEIGRHFQDAHTLWRALPDEKPTDPAPEVDDNADPT